jgi:L-ascorbate metabolism protein UlaG (beta-lactamase superfamily)
MSPLDVFGAAPAGQRLERMRASPNFADGRAQNLEDTPTGPSMKMFSAMGQYAQGGQTPDVELPVAEPGFGSTSRELQATWLGHSSTLLDIDGVRLLTDPVLSKRVAPSQWVGPARFHKAPLTAEELPELDAVLLSHDHYDHLDHGTLQVLAKAQCRIITPLGVGAHLELWGVEPERITELDWWESTQIGAVEVTLTPSRHFSGRGPTDRNRTLWGSYAIVGPTHKVWFSGDTGPFEAATLIRDRFGGFDLTMIECGAHHPAWGTIHLGPLEAEKLHRMVGGGILMPVHWGTFSLAPHRWDAPIVELLQHAARGGTRLVAPVAGQTLDPRQPFVHDFWLERAAQAVPGQTPAWETS